MSERVLLVGGDRSEGFERALDDARLELVAHWHGRKPKEARWTLPPGVDLVVVVWDRISHALAESVRAQAAARGLAPLYCRSSSDLRRQLPPRMAAGTSTFRAPSAAGGASGSSPAPTPPRGRTYRPGA
jgi:hypothetical protein